MRKRLTAIVLAAMLVATLAGVAWARSNGGPQGADITRKVTLAAGDFIPMKDDWNYTNFGPYLYCDGSVCEFTAPVAFPCLPAVTVERIKLRVVDNSGSAYAVATLYRKSPTSLVADVNLGSAQSPAEPSTGLETFTSADINKVVWPSQRAWVKLEIAGEYVYVFGVAVEYHRNI